MIWSLRTAAALGLAWLIYLASPFVALHSIGKAVENGDLAVIQTRVNFVAVRLSLLKQVVNAYVDEVGGAGLSAADRQLAVQAGWQVAEPIVADLLSPAVIIDLLDDGWPQTIAPLQPGERAETARDAADSTLPGDAAEPREEIPVVRIGRLLRIGSVWSAWQMYRQSELHGFRHVHISVPAGKPLGERFGLRMRLSGSTWKLISIELPDGVLKRLIRRISNHGQKRGEGFGNLLAGAPSP